MFHIRKLFAVMLILVCAVPALAEAPTPTPWPVEMMFAQETSAPETAVLPDLTPAAAELPSEEAADSVPAAVTPAPVVNSGMEDDGMIRVHLKSLGAPTELNLRFPGSYAVEGDPGFRFEDGAELTVVAHEGSVWFCAGGMMVDMGESATLTRHGEQGFYIEESEKNTAYTGDLTLTVQRGILRPVLSIHIEEYLYGVVAYEMSDSFPVEALKAQAVAARTYAMERKFSAGSRDYDVVDTTGDQVYKGFDPDYKNVIAAVDATRGVVGTYNGGFAGCYYTASNGGQVSPPNDIWGGSGDDDYIELKDDPFDLENPGSMVNRLTFAKDLSDHAQLKKMIVKQLDKDCEFVSVNKITPVQPSVENTRMYTKLRFELNVRVEIPAPETTPETKPFLGLDLGGLFGGEKQEPEYEDRLAYAELTVYEDIKKTFGLGINSSDCELVSIAEDEATFTIEMRRFGHGVGMSQRGAQQMAGQYEYKWEEILGFYYPGMTLEKIDWPEKKIETLDGKPTVHGYRRPQPTPRPTPKPLPPLEKGEKIGVVNLTDPGSTLNVREMPTTSSRILDRLEPGWKVIVCSEPDADGWVSIRTAELNGYVKLEYLDVE